MGDMVLYAAAVLLPLVFSSGLYAFVANRRSARVPARWPQLAIGNTLVLVLGLSVVFLMGETYYRFVYDATDSFSQTRTSAQWFERHFQRNNAGFRDGVDYGFSRRSSTPRVSFVGDSFTAGHGIANVEDRFANRVRNAKRGQWEVHVLAEVGRDTGAEIKLLRDLVREGYQFDRVVLVYCLNDINDIVPAQQNIAARAAERGWRPGFIVEHSFFINTAYYRLKARLDPDVSQYYDFVRTAYDGPLWDEQRERLREFHDTCQAAGGRPVVVTFPFMHSLGTDNPYRPIHEKLDQFWAELRTPHLDLLPVFEPHAGERLTVNRYDAHPNEQAHAIAAEAIIDFLEKQSR